MEITDLYGRTINEANKGFLKIVMMNEKTENQDTSFRKAHNGKKKTVYISGKISGLPILEARKIFDEAEARITASGNLALNPMKISPYHPKKKWTDYMREDIKALMDADEIYMLIGWKDSRGARIEHILSRLLDIKITYEKMKKPAITRQDLKQQFSPELTVAVLKFKREIDRSIIGVTARSIIQWTNTQLSKII